MDTVWERMPGLIPADDDRSVLFIEEDHALSPDFYVTMKAMLAYARQCGRSDHWGLSLSRGYVRLGRLLGTRFG
jgi:hypothetical protein